MNVAIQSQNGLLQKDMQMIAKCTTKEELLLAVWKTRKHHSDENEAIQSMLRQKAATLQTEKLLAQKDTVIQMLVDPFNAFSTSALDKISKEVGLTPYEIESVLQLEQNLHADKKEFHTYVKMLEKLQEKVHPYVGEIDEMDIRQQQEAEIAKMTLSLYLDSDCLLVDDFCKTTGCTNEEFENAIHVLTNVEDPMLQQYFAKHKETVANSNYNMEDYEILNNKDSKALVDFCRRYDLDFRLTRLFLMHDLKSSSMVLAQGSREEKQQVINEFKDVYGNLVQLSAQRMYQILRISQRNKKLNIKQPEPLFPFYDLWSEHSISVQEIVDLGKIIGGEYPVVNGKGEPIDSGKVIGKFVSSHNSLFEEMNERSLKGTKCAGVLSCTGHVVQFTSSEFDRAMEGIDDKGMLKYRGIVFQAIEKQVNKKKETTDKPKVLKKTQD